MDGGDQLLTCPRLIQRWCRRWGTPALAGKVTCEWSSRLRRSLGRAYPERCVVRLSTLLREASYRDNFEHVLCHEVAHVAAFYIHGRSIACHGPQWQNLVRLVGHTPEARRETLTISVPQEAPSVCYEHLCPVCQSTRISTRPQRHWRCVACTRAGLEGRLIVQSRPRSRKFLDA
jgi:SprT protein